ncbi:tetratricopeptide repeat protein [Streptomyces anulatus]|uniref:tetratricopeptide repeat protein n=1 Tax=Streptomyces anulatus TaxID=1892 RepID=UPI00386E93B8|nr:tetratricopeptide repeat protein [Streptomyces anulatus]
MAASGLRSVAAAGSIGAVTTGDHSPLTVSVYPPAPAPTALASLPAAPSTLSGRDTEVEQVLSVLRPHAVPPQRDVDHSEAGPIAVSAADDVPAPVLVTSVAGLAGVGKTALALACGHAAFKAGWFSGSLFIDLRGYDESPVQPGQALEALLRALGVESAGIPAAAEERAALYRSALEDCADQGHRLLIVADNAASADQVRLLLPGSRRHQVLITSRHTLATLNARLVDLAVLSPEAAEALLRHALQRANPADRRVLEAGDSAEELAGLCGYLPLALHISAALLILEPDQTVGELAAELATARSRLSLLDDGERAVRASFDLSYRRLPPDHAELLRLLALNPGPDIGLEAVAVLAARPLPAIRTMLRALVQAHLLDCVNRRWSMHDLVRDYATELVHDTQQAAAHGAGQDGATGAAELHTQAYNRLLEHYATTALAANAHLTAGAHSSAPDEFANQDEALAWLDSERVNLTASVTAAAAIGHQDIALRLPVILYDYLIWYGYFDDLIAVTTTACGLAHQTGALAAEAGAWNNLGIALTEASRYKEAVLAHRRAADLFASMDNHNEHGKALNGLGSVLRDSGEPIDARQIHQEALAIQRACGDLQEQAAVLNNLSLDHQELGNAAAACTAAEEAASLYQQLGDTTNEAKALSTAAFALQASGQSKEAQAVCERAIEAASRAVGNPRDEAAILMTCAELLTDLTLQQRIAYLVQAQAACERANAHDLCAHVLSAIGRAWITAGDTRQAAAHLTRAKRMFEDLDLAGEAADVRELLALLQP